MSALALLLPALLLGTEPPRTPLEEALQASTAIAFGQVERIDRRGGHWKQLLTLRVEHVARGELPDVITVDATPPKGVQSNPSLGTRMIVFLEPTHPEEPRWRLVLGGIAWLATLRPGNEPRGTYSVYPNRWSHLCEVDAFRTEEGGSCSVRLDAFLRALGLRPFTPPPREATFQIIPPRQCEPCELEEALKKQGVPGARDCGTAPPQGLPSPVVQCVRESLAAHMPFQVRLKRRGVDSTLVESFVSGEGGFHQLSFDSSIEGGGKCSALVAQTPCGSLALKEKDVLWLQCEQPGETQVLCAQSWRVDTLGPPEKVSRLDCPAEDDRRNRICDVLPAGVSPGKHAPRPDGPDSLCTPRGSRLVCREP